MWIYDAFAEWYYDVLDTTPGTNYVQNADGVLALSGGAAQEWPGAYEQHIDCTLFLHGGASQQWVAPTGAQAYEQTSNGFILLLGGAFQEHSPAFGGQFGQSGNGVITFTGGAFQQHIPGANPGDHLQIGNGQITLLGGALQVHLAPEFSRLVSRNVDSVLPYGANAVQPIPFSFGAPPPSISRVTITFTSTDAKFLSGVGPLGGALFVEVSLREGARTPLVSVSAQRPMAEFFVGQQSSAFAALVAAITDGETAFELRGYEALPGRAAPQHFGPGTLTVEVLP